LLKILEEPAEYSQIFLVAQSLNTILPTIISRCRVLNAKNKNEVTQEKEEFLSMNISEKFILAEALSKKEKTEVISYLNQILFEIKNSNLDFSKESIYFFIETQEKISKYNLNIRLALENLFLNFEIPEKKV
jgi:DNA polymerase III delta prime subunit